MNVRVALSYVENRFVCGMSLYAVKGSEEGVVVLRDKGTDFFSFCVKLAKTQLTIYKVKL